MSEFVLRPIAELVTGVEASGDDFGLASHSFSQVLSEVAQKSWLMTG